MNTKDKPIGIFDSGLGGLTVVKEIIRILPHEDLVYLGDTARVPYGTRSNNAIIKFSLEDANFLLKKKVKCIVVACNTASSVAGETLKKKLKVPVFEVISAALENAKTVSKSGRIGVIGTRATITSGAYKVPYSVACPLLVPFIEEGEIASPALKLVAKKYLSAFKSKKIDTLILGCTHYPIIGGMIRQIMGKKVKLINPEKSVAFELKEYLTGNQLLNSKKVKGVRKYFVTDLTRRFTKTAEMFLGHKIEVLVSKTNL